MAEVSFLHFPEEDHELFVEHDLYLEEISTLDSLPYWSHIPDSASLSPCRHPVDDDADEIFPSISSNQILGPSNGSISADNIIEDRNNQVNFVMDLFHQRVEQSHLVNMNEFVSENVSDLNFGVIEENYDENVNSLDLELHLGLGLGLEDDDCNCGGFVVSDCGDEFYIARRESGSDGRNENEIPSSSLRIGEVGIDSDSEEDDELLRIHVHSEEEENFGIDNVNDEDLGSPLCWDSFQLEEDNNNNIDLEWEEVDDGVDEREVLSVVADPDEEGLISVLPISGSEEDGFSDRGRELRNLEWEVLLNNNNLERSQEMMEYDTEVGAYFGDHDDIVNTAEYELMFGQFAESESAFLGRPPASKSVIEKLPSVITTKEEVLNEKALCAVCKDQIEVGEEGKQLPCSHRYHGDCILPWLGIRNTCPVCRYELPTDDPEYEQRRVRRAASVV